MKAFILLAAVLASTQGLAQEQARSCWDGSFAYNSASAQINDHMIEILLQGHQLVPEELTVSDYSKDVVIGSWDFSRVYAVFARQDCRENGKVLACTSILTHGYGPELWIEGLIDGQAAPITNVSLRTLRAKWDADGIELNFIDRLGQPAAIRVDCEKDGKHFKHRPLQEVLEVLK